MANPAEKMAILNAATDLLKANNTVTTLEIKLALRKSNPHGWWNQQDISDTMRELSTEGKFDFIDNGTFRVYSGTPAPVATAVSPLAPVAKRPVGRPRKSVTTPAAGPTAAPSPTPQPATPAAKAPKVKVIAGLKGTGKTNYLSRTSALKMMANNKGHYFTAVFIDKKGKERLMNCQWLKDQSGADLGYVKVKEATLIRQAAKATNFNAKGEPLDANGKPIRVIRNVNVQTLLAIKIAGVLYKIR